MTVGWWDGVGRGHASTTFSHLAGSEVTARAKGGGRCEMKSSSGVPAAAHRVPAVDVHVNGG